jgi:N-acetylglucosaminyl-diphospho-decaprenol L-rhamnosyltransferase
MLDYGVFQSNISTSAGQHDGNGAVDVSVIIVSWNVRPLLERCLQAVLDEAMSASLKLEVIVVDNASNDGSADAAARAGVQIIQTGRNLGYGRANNVGFQAARGRYMLVLNPDTVTCPGSIETIYRFAARSPRAGIVAPRLLNSDGTVQRSAFRFPTILMAALDLFPPPVWLPGRIRLAMANSRLNGRYSDEPARRRPFRCDHPLGAALLLRRDALERCGGFDPGIFMYSEEIDLAMRFREAGYSCWQVPEAEIIHLGGQSTGQLRGEMFVELWRSRLYIYRKHRSPAGQLALRALLASAMLFRLALARLPLPNRKAWDASATAARETLALALGKADE